MKIVLIGPPGSGKGTQSDFISERYKIPHISMGELCREFAKKRTKKAKIVKKFMNEGKLVPDELTVELLKKRLKKGECKKGFVLDGYPRNLNQVRLLKNSIKIDYVIYLDVSATELVKRLSTRWQCSECKAIYGSAALPGKKWVCDKCKIRLFQRDDDKPAAIRERIKIFKKLTMPLIRHYGKEGILRRLDGNKKPEEVSRLIKKILG